jgi:arylsulfatase A-like enzyme
MRGGLSLRRGCLALLIAGAVCAAAPGPAAAAPPNVLLIVTDDQRDAGTMEVMPDTLRYFKTYGTSFSNAYVTTPLCCPSRSTIFSGRFAHNHVVRNNIEAPNLDQQHTIQQYLHDAGYETGIFGKYLNGWNLWLAPPGFDRWSIIGGWDASYSPYVNEQGTIKHLAELSPPVYSTRYVQDKAVDFLARAEREDSRPWFLTLTPKAPHPPAIPEDRYASAPVSPITTTEAYFEPDLSDKPPWWSELQSGPSSVESFRAKQLRTLMSVDDMVARVFAELRRRGEDDNTFAVFTSDNGFHWGEHGLFGKGTPYPESLEVPLFMRWPLQRRTVRRGAVDSRIAANVDLAPTILGAAGVSPPAGSPQLDGVSLLDKSWHRSRLLTEYWSISENEKTVPPWASVRAPGYQYTEYYGEDGVTPLEWSDGTPIREYYDLTTDPNQVRNLLHDGDAANDPATASLSSQLAGDRLCSGSSCRPGGGTPPSADATAPTVEVTSPVSPSLSGLSRFINRSVFLGAFASDNLGIAGVQYKVDGVNVGTEDVESPYTVTWDTTTVADGAHLITAVARDAAGNTATSVAEQVTVDNTSPSGSDLQTCAAPATCGPTVGVPENGDSLTYYFSSPIDPTSLIAGWDGSARTVSARISPDVPQFNYADTLSIDGVPNLGTVDTVLNTYNGWYDTLLYSASTLQMSADRRSATLALGGGTPGLPIQFRGYMIWSPGAGVRDALGRTLCTCQTVESGTFDRDF